jgi:Zn-dependent protease/CBS domain-containing protein
MTGTFTIGRIFGIEVNLHWSWLFIFLLITWTFAAGILEDIYPGWTASQRWLVGAIVSAVFFVSILFHELSHSLVARRFGIPVSSITLFVFGGVSSLEKEAANAKQEFWIAIVGPLTSYAMAVLFGLGYLILRNLEPGVAELSAHLAIVNAAIGTFNLVPGFPLDGGRVLRSVFWARRRNIFDATRLASRIGEYVAYSMMGLGFLMFLFVSVVSGIWLFLIGNFLRIVAAASYQQLVVGQLLSGVPARAVARRDYAAVSPDLTVEELVESYFLAGRGRCFPVVAGEELLGIVTLSDVRRVPRDDWNAATVYRAMTPAAELMTVQPDEDLTKVMEIMTSGGLNQIPVLEGRLLAGMIERSDIIAYIQARQLLGARNPQTMPTDTLSGRGARPPGPDAISPR